MLYQTYLKLDNQEKSLVREDAVCQRLMRVPGVGSITALTFKADVDDPTLPAEDTVPRWYYPHHP